MSAPAAAPSPTPEELELRANKTCLAVHALCDALPEVQAVLSLIASHPATPDSVRGRCLGLWYKLHDAHVKQAEELELRPTKTADVTRRLTGRATELRR